MSSKISANLSGDSGFQSACTNGSLEKSIEYKLNDAKTSKGSQSTLI